MPQISKASPLGPFCHYVDFGIPEKGVFLTRSERIHYNLYDSYDPRSGPTDPNYSSWEIEDLDYWRFGTGSSRLRKYNFSLKSLDESGNNLRQNRLSQIQFGFCNVSSVSISLSGAVEIADPRYDRLRVEIYSSKYYTPLEPFAIITNTHGTSGWQFQQPTREELPDDWRQIYHFEGYKSYEVKELVGITPLLTVMIESEKDTPEHLHSEEVETMVASNSIQLDVNDPCGYIMRITSETGDPNWNLNVSHEAVINFITSSD